MRIKNKFYLNMRTPKKNASIYFLGLFLILESCFGLDQNVTMALNDNRDFNIDKSTCLTIKIPQMYQSSFLKIESKNVVRILLTDIYDSKQTNKIPTCHSNSTVCSEYDNTDNIEYLNSICSLNLYVIACTDENVEFGAISIKSSFNKTQGCNPINRGHFEDCLSLSSDGKCSNPSLCSTKCEELSCNFNGERRTFCMPKIKDFEMTYNQFCSTTFNTKESTFTTKKCEPNSSNQFNKPDNKESSFYKTIAVLVGIAILAIIVSSFYYRLKLKEEGIPPFNPPEFMPGFIYPRPKKDALLINK